jgi:hypothetical protein
LSKAPEVNIGLTALELDSDRIQPQTIPSIAASTRRHQQLPQQIAHAALFLEIASGPDWPHEMATVRIQQMASLPGAGRRNGLATIGAMSAELGHPRKDTRHRDTGTACTASCMGVHDEKRITAHRQGRRCKPSAGKRPGPKPLPVA